mmetsp:Transcript_18537/g.32174  ORF Transcript_18537/g.32174 Transcript_18537/m.32174 type:complete len:205 (-) Transcript_18537:867-1481(-)
MASTEAFDEQFKCLLVGDSGVGKSSMLLRFTDNIFEELQPTIGVDFKVKAMDIDGQHIKLTIWDTAGQERFRTLTTAYYRGAHGVILVYDVAKRQSFDALRKWINEAKEHCTLPDAVTMIVGNKVDLENERQVSREEGIEFARENHSLFAEASAKTFVGVQYAFEELARKILETPSLCKSIRDGDKGGSVNINQSGNDESACAC